MIRLYATIGKGTLDGRAFIKQAFIDTFWRIVRKRTKGLKGHVAVSWLRYSSKSAKIVVQW